LKVTVLEIYNKKLDKRADRKRLIFEHDLINYKNNKTFEEENYKTKEEKEFANRIKPFTQLLCKKDYTTFRDDLEDGIKAKIEKRLEYRKMGIKTHSESSRYERRKLQKEINRELAAQPHTGHLTNVSGSDRLAARYVSKVSPVRFNE
ncbi:1974_t:CDS:2, partial [Entrophospora sp. SA101]